MPKLTPRLNGRAHTGTKPEDASREQVGRYINNCVWQSGFVAKAFEADSQPKLAKIAQQVHELSLELRKTWRGR